MKILFSLFGVMAIALPVVAQDIPLSKILVEKEDWRALAKGLPKITFLKAESGGSIGIYQNVLLHRLGADGKLEKLPKPPGPSDVLLSSGFVTRAGAGYHIELTKKSVYTVGLEKNQTLKLAGLTAPTCVTAWPDGGHLVIGEADGAYLWAVRLEKDGSFGPGDRYYSLRTRPNEKMHVTAMTMDAGYLLYACTPLGVQVFDPTGRLSGVIPAPSKEPMTSITIGGAKADELFVAAGDKIFARRIQGKASYTLKK